MDWQPIETAPKDGEPVLLFWWYYYPGDRSPTAGMILGWWNDERQGWEDASEDIHKPSLFSHWMRPEPPAIPPKPVGAKSFVFPPDAPSPPSTGERNG